MSVMMVVGASQVEKPHSCIKCCEWVHACMMCAHHNPHQWAEFVECTCMYVWLRNLLCSPPCTFLHINSYIQLWFYCPTHPKWLCVCQLCRFSAMKYTKRVYFEFMGGYNKHLYSFVGSHSCHFRLSTDNGWTVCSWSAYIRVPSSPMELSH